MYQIKKMRADNVIDFAAEDPVLDDVVHIETDEKGGILTGSNSRSVLFAVYRYLKEYGYFGKYY